MELPEELTIFEMGKLRLFLIDKDHVIPLEEVLQILKPGTWIDVSILQVWCK
jgi:hypothetical protein